MERYRRFLIVLAFSLTPSRLVAQQADPALLTIDRLFSAEFTPQPLSPPRFIEKGAAYAALEKPAGSEHGRDIVRYDTKTGKRSILVSAEQLTPAGAKTPLAIEDYSWSDDMKRLLVFTNSQRVWRQNTRGDYWLFDLEAKKLGKLGGSAKPSTLMFAKFSPDGKRVGYVRENNLYVEQLADHKIKQLTSDGSERIINGTFDWVHEEELDLRDGWRWSPDGRHIAYWQLDTAGVKEFPLVNDTAGVYPTITRLKYPKTGETNSAVRVGVVNHEGGPTTWLKIPGDPRNYYLARMEWAANSEEVMVQRLNRLQNANDVMLANARSGEVHTMFVERDNAWVDVYENSLNWLEDGKRFTWLSERDGWRHLYVITRDGDAVRRVTPGPFDVIQLETIDTVHGYAYYIASPENATQRYLYRVSLNSGSPGPERITPKDQPGTHSYTIAPNHEWAVHTYSTFTDPPRIELIHLPDHTVTRTLVDNAPLRDKVRKLSQGGHEFFKVDVGHGLDFDAWIMKPPHFDPAHRYPVLFHVYGEPASLTVTDAWRQQLHLWHLMLTQRGYVVMSVENRGTPAPRGRDWRKVIYRKMGVIAPADQAAAAQVLTKRPYVDSARIAIWGWSGGGSNSLNAIFRFPEIYRAAMAVAPVTDWRYYDTIYTERYMGLPQDNAEDYRRGSPITFATQLKGRLLVVHGTGDDNVHYQNTEALINALIAANKPFTVMPYPNRSHGIYEGHNTTRHLFELLTQYLNENVLPGPKRTESAGVAKELAE
jgi:dipeptidyl-peptidase-4